MIVRVYSCFLATLGQFSLGVNSDDNLLSAKLNLQRIKMDVFTANSGKVGLHFCPGLIGVYCTAVFL